MRRFLPVLALCLVALALAACCGEPTLTVRSPISLGMEPMRVQGPSGIMVPQTMYPQYQAAPGGCAPSCGIGSWFGPGVGYSVPQFQAPGACTPPAAK